MFVLRQFVTISRLTVLEAVRQPLSFLLFATTLSIIALMPLTLSHTLGESSKFVRDGALAFMMLAGLILGAHLACSALSAEMRRGTVSAVLSKPVNRTVFFLAKYVGIALLMTVFSAGLLMAILLAVRAVHEPWITDWWAAGPLIAVIILSFLLGGLINFFLRRPFISNTFVTLFVLLLLAFFFSGFVDAQGEPATFGLLYDFRILRAGGLIILAIWVLSAISVALATRLSTIPTLAFCGFVFFFGLLSDYLFGRFADTVLWAKVLYYALPNWQHFWVVDALAADTTIPIAYVLHVGVYALCYTGVVLIFGLLAFKQMEVEA